MIRVIGESLLREATSLTLDLYVSNGAFIAAAIALEFKIKRTHSKSPNVFLPISDKSVKEMKEQEKKILHNCSGY